MYDPDKHEELLNVAADLLDAAVAAHPTPVSFEGALAIGEAYVGLQGQLVTNSARRWRELVDRRMAATGLGDVRPSTYARIWRNRELLTEHGIDTINGAKFLLGRQNPAGWTLEKDRAIDRLNAAIQGAKAAGINRDHAIRRVDHGYEETDHD